MATNSPISISGGSGLDISARSFRSSPAKSAMPIITVPGSLGSNRCRISRSRSRAGPDFSMAGLGRRFQSTRLVRSNGICNRGLAIRWSCRSECRRAISRRPFACLVERARCCVGCATAVADCTCARNCWQPLFPGDAYSDDPAVPDEAIVPNFSRWDHPDGGGNVTDIVSTGPLRAFSRRRSASSSTTAASRATGA
jgi:hypothetical protein